MGTRYEAAVSSYDPHLLLIDHLLQQIEQFLFMWINVAVRFGDMQDHVKVHARHFLRLDGPDDHLPEPVCTFAE